MKPITYKGYQASVEYEDGSLFIKVLHIDDLLVSECERASEVEACARALIDDYIQTCEELGRDPQKPFKGSFNVRMEPGLHRRAAMAAADLGVSLNSWICVAATEKLDCNGIAERFDGVFSKKRQEMNVSTIVQLLTAQHSLDSSLIATDGWHVPFNRDVALAYTAASTKDYLAGRGPRDKVKMHG